MRRLLTYVIVALLTVSCSKETKSTFTINGKAGDGEGTLYLFGLDSRNETINAIECNSEGEFTYTMTADTIIPMVLLFPDGKSITVYGEPGITATLVKDDDMHNGWSVDGGTAQALHDSISRVIDKYRRKDDRIKAIDNFIETHPISETSIEIIRRYLIDIPEPNNSDIRSRISKLGGMMQDHEFIATAKKKTEQKNSNIQNRTFPTFSYETNEKKNITVSTYLKKYLLVTYWSTWEEACRAEMKRLRNIKESLDSNYFAVLNISFDHDTACWKERLATDSIPGDNVCDRMAWNSQHAEKLNIPSLPYSILVNPYTRIIRYGVELDKAEKQIFEPVNKFIKDEKEKKEKDKKKKRNK